MIRVGSESGVGADKVHSDDLAKSLQKKSCKSCSQEFTGTAVVCPHDGTLLTPVVSDHLIGTVLSDRYKVLSVAGKGGMGTVYKGTHMLMDRTVAIKMLHAHLISDAHALQRFQQEAKASCALTHPNIISVFDFGIAPEGQPYLVMEYLKGHSLAEILEREKTLRPARALHIFIQTCDALTHAHANGVVHRDLKPSNIVLTFSGEDKNFVKIVDFGIAKLLPSAGRESMQLTQTGEVFGSPLYMSPEQCMAQKLDNRADIYSLGCVIYETLTGVPPLVGKHSVDTIQKHVNEMPRPLRYANPDISVPDGMEPVLFKALAKDPNQRYQSMQELKEDLEKVRSGSQPGMVAPANRPDSKRLPSQEAPREEIPADSSKSSSPPRPQATSGFNQKLTAFRVIAFLIAAILCGAAWATYNAYWYPSFIDPSLLWPWYNQAQETRVQAGQLDVAERFAIMAVRAANQQEEPKLRMARSLNELGEIYVMQHRYSDAELSLEKALAIRDRADSLDNPDAVTIMLNLARLYNVEGKLSFAEMQYEKLITHEKLMFGEQHPEVAKIHAELAAVYNADDKAAEAEKQYRRALTILQTDERRNRALIPPILHNYAKLLISLKRKPEADKMEGQASILRQTTAK
jgi:serine/threonine protein kinase/Tfp pilus assembly protein PilF